MKKKRSKPDRPQKRNPRCVKRFRKELVMFYDPLRPPIVQGLTMPETTRKIMEELADVAMRRTEIVFTNGSTISFESMNQTVKKLRGAPFVYDAIDIVAERVYLSHKERDPELGKIMDEMIEAGRLRVVKSLEDL